MARKRQDKKSLLRQLDSLFNRRERWQLVILSVALVIRAGVEMVGVASVMPFMSVVADPELVQTNAYLAAAYEWLGFETVLGFTFALGVAVLVFLVVANSFSAMAVYGTTRFVWGMHHRLAMRLFRGYLHMPYGFFTNRNSASFHKTLLNECQEVVRGVMEPILNLIAKTLVVVAIIVLLLVTDPVLACIVVVMLAGSYGILYTVVKAKQRRLGLERVTANQERFKVTGEAFGGIKDVKVLQRENAFVKRFYPASRTFSRAMSSNNTIRNIPRYFFEAIGFGGIVIIVLYYLNMGHGIETILPVVSLYAFAGYRLMPELQHLFAAVAQVRFTRAALDDLTTDLATVEEYSQARTTTDALPFEKGIRVKNVRFSYPGSDKPALDGITLFIERNQTIGLVGSSGSGKTTLVDLILGLYEPDGGCIQVGSTLLDEITVGAWRHQVGYVPQYIFLTDDTIAANIAFGVQPSEIDLTQVERAARIAHVHEFITTMPNAYQTVVGERGVRLSGGQRQRIGIARALYHNPEVLILDEATSALDGITEEAVMDAIRELAGQKTILIIAHRLSTVLECDAIYLLKDGKVSAYGTYEHLAKNNIEFRTMAKLNSVALKK